MIFNELKRVRALAFRAEDLLCGGQILLSDQGKMYSICSYRDLRALEQASRARIPLALFGDTEIQQQFQPLLQQRGIACVWISPQEEKYHFEAWLNSAGLTRQQTCFVGADFIDLDLMKEVGVSCCAQDAAEEIKQCSLYISPKSGGNGALRDISEKILKLQGKWNIQKD